MKPEDLKILVISFYFPPYNRVGGRRWAKHVKYMHRRNIPVYVLTGDFSGDFSSWDKDIIEFENNVYRIKHLVRKPIFFQSCLPESIKQKIKWKFSYYLWNFKKQFLKGNYLDQSVGNETIYEEKASELIQKHRINTLIITVGPFAYSKILINLKKRFSQVKYIIDYRDLWEDGFKDLSAEQILAEQELQHKVIENVDLILSPNIEMKKHYELSFNKNVYCLPHCFDTEDIAIINTVSKNSIIKLVYGGAFYNDINENIELIKRYIDLLSQKKMVQAEFYISTRGYEKDLYHPAIKRFDFIDSVKYFRLVQESDYAILILPPNRVNAMSSKFFELVALRKPILYFGGKGEVSDYLIKHGLGYHITVRNLEKIVEETYNNIKLKNVPDLSYNISSHSFELQTNPLLEKLVSL